MAFKTEKQKIKKPDNTSFAKLFKAVILGFKIIFWEWQVFLISVINCCLTIGNEIATWHIYEINAEFARALVSNDYDLFITCVWAGVKSAAIRSSIDTVRTLSADICNIVYRRNAIEQAHRKYFHYETYFRLNAIDKEGVDNPDQRITTDISNICNFYAVYLIPTMTSTLFVTIYYTHKIYKIANWEGITILYAVAILSVLVNLVFVKPVGKWTNRIEKSEGWFRYKHCTIRDNAESTAMYDASKFENKECMRLVDQIMIKNLWLGCWQCLKQLINSFIFGNQNIMIATILYFPLVVERNEVGDIMEFITLSFYQCFYLYNFAIGIASNVETLLGLAGVFRRVYEFFAFTDKNWNECISDNAYADVNIHYQDDAKDALQFDSVCYETPVLPTKVLMKDLNLTLKKGENLLVSGPSGCGKSAFLRTITKLWKIKSGTLTIGILDREVFVMPQKPYFPTGNLTLRQQIIFSELIDDRNVPDKEMHEFITDLHLDTVLEKCGGLDVPVDFEWHERFTPAELQQISFMRVLYHQPKLVLMDDVSSCCSAAVERRLYELLDGLGISYISAGNRVALRAFHHKELKLHGDGTYEVVDLRDDPFV